MKKPVLILLALPVVALMLVASMGFFPDYRQSENLTGLNIINVSFVNDGVETFAPRIAQTDNWFFIQGIMEGTKLRIFYTYEPSDIFNFDEGIIGINVSNNTMFHVSGGGRVVIDYRGFYLELTLTGILGNSEITIFDRTNNIVESVINIHVVAI